MTTSTHIRHQVRITSGPDPLDQSVEIDGRVLEAAARIDVTITPDDIPHVTITHDCWDLVIAGVATVDHQCGRPYQPSGDQTGYLGVLRVMLREFASRVLLAGDVTGLQRETVLDQVETDLERLAEDCARAALAGAAKVILAPGWALDDGSDDRPETATDFLYIDGQAVRNLDLDPGLHAVIRLRGAAMTDFYATWDPELATDDSDGLPDRKIVPMVEALRAAGFTTFQSCQGHPGQSDGRLLIREAPAQDRWRFFAPFFRVQHVVHFPAEEPLWEFIWAWPDLDAALAALWSIYLKGR